MKNSQVLRVLSALFVAVVMASGPALATVTSTHAEISNPFELCNQVRDNAVLWYLAGCGLICGRDGADVPCR